MLTRTLEPEVMDTAQEARDYDAMDHSDVNRRFVDDFLALIDELGIPANELQPLRVLDVGTGTALIPIELCRRREAFLVTAVDLAEEMLKVGRSNVSAAGLEECIRLERVDAKQMPFADSAFDAVVSNSIVHHIPDPEVVFREMFRVLKPGGPLLVRDLLRPESVEEVEHLVTTYAGLESAGQQQLFRQSLHAALTVEEVAAIVTACGKHQESVSQTSDRHWTIVGRV